MKVGQTARIFPRPAEYRKGYSTGMKVIHKLELKIEKPKAGHHSSMDLVITVPKGASYKIGRTAWYQRLSDDSIYPLDNSYFHSGGDYGINFRAIAKEGYVFADDLIIVINGVELSADSLRHDNKIIDGMFFFSDYVSGGTGKKSAGGVATGDDTNMLPLVLAASIAALTGAGLLFTRRRKEI